MPFVHGVSNVLEYLTLGARLFLFSFFPQITPSWGEYITRPIQRKLYLHPLEVYNTEYGIRIRTPGWSGRCCCYRCCCRCMLLYDCIYIYIYVYIYIFFYIYIFIYIFINIYILNTFATNIFSPIVYIHPLEGLKKSDQGAP